MPSFASALSFGRGGGKFDIASASSVQSASASAPVPRLAKSRSTSLFAKAPKTPVETATSVLSRPALTPGSSCSSDGSASLQTPEDEVLMHPLSKLDEKKRWSTWFGRRKQSEKDPVPDNPPRSSRSPPQAVATANTRGDKLQLQQQLQQQQLARREATQSASDDDDDDQISSDSSDSPESSTVIVRRFVPPRSAVVQARANMRTLLRNTLSRSPSLPPLVETSSTLFPRSCAMAGNFSSSQQHALSLESSMHVRKMLWRLDHQILSDVEADSIVGLAQRPRPKDASSQNRMEKRSDDDIIAYATMRVGRYSRGLRKWALRPNFEQRFSVWMPDERGTIVCKGVVGVRGLAVCDLEFSEGIEALAGLDLDDEAFEQNLFPIVPPPKRFPLKLTPRTQSSPPGTPRKPSFNRTSSPLRIDYAAPAEPVLSAVSPSSSAIPNAKSSDPIVLDIKSSGVSRGPSADLGAERGGPPTSPIRDDPDADESIPLGYALQAKKRRQEKARFLQTEREKRAKELAAIEKQRRETEERREVEERRRREEERKRIEEERRAREERIREKYNEEIAASRQRRESARLGMESYLNIRETHQADNRRTYTRPSYDPTISPIRLPKRSASDFAVPGQGMLMTDGSSNSSRPNSFVESTGDNRRSLAAPSHSLSHQLNDDSRFAYHRRSSGATEASQRPQQQHSRPASIVSSSSRPASVRVQSAPNQVPIMAYPMVPVMPMMPQMPVLPVPPVPPVPPMSMWNMPLLPPNAPFMMQQYSRSSSPGSNPHSRNHSPSSSPSRRPSDIPPPSPSRRQSNLHSSSSSSPSRAQHTGQSSSRPVHSRHPSGDNNHSQHPANRRGSNTASQHPTRSTSNANLQQSVPQPTHRDSRSQKLLYGSSTNLAHMDPKRRTSMM
ncbi:hypothetical protein ACEPAH_5928 [Sanghuangporus vaninii]